MWDKLKFNAKLSLTLIRREIWENWRIWFYSLLFFSLIKYVITVFTAITGFVYLKLNGVNVAPEWAVQAVHKISLHYFLYDWSFSSESFFLIVNVAMWVHIYSIISRERENNALGFWRSLPPADGAVLSAKLITVLCVAPVLCWIAVLMLWCVVAAFVFFAFMLSQMTGMWSSGASPMVLVQHSWLHTASVFSGSYWRTSPILWTFSDFFTMLPVRALWLLPLVSFLVLFQTMLKRGSVVALVICFGSVVSLGYVSAGPFRVPGEFVVNHLRYGMGVANLSRFQIDIDVTADVFPNSVPWPMSKKTVGKLSEEQQKQTVEFKQKAIEKWKTPVAEYLSRIPNSTFFPGLGLSAVLIWFTLWLRKRHARW